MVLALSTLCSSEHVHSVYDIESSDMMTLFRRGIPSRLVIFPDENHWVMNHGNR
jgi:hypothetical protein